MSAVETFPDKIAAALKPVVAAEARRILDAKADSPTEKAKRQADLDIMAACRRVAEAYDDATARGISGRTRAAARSKLFTENAKLKRLMIKHGRMPASEAQ